MVIGLDTFRDFFEGFEDSYILIGGAASDRQFEDKGIAFRTTKDLDIILVAEAITPTFVSRFWEFIEEGEYTIAQTSQGKQCSYRFVKPQVSGFPYMLELFSRLPDVITLKEGMHLTPIPAGEDVDSLSAILMDDTYYQYTIANSQILDGVHTASERALICLKAKAYLDLTKRKAEGEHVNNEDIRKHRNDVIKFIATIPRTTVGLPEAIATDLLQFIEQIETEQPIVKDTLLQVGITNISLKDILDLIRQLFNLPTSANSIT